MATKYFIGQTMRGNLGSYTLTHQLYRDRVWRAINDNQENVIIKMGDAGNLVNEWNLLKRFQNRNPFLRPVIDEIEDHSKPQALVLKHLDDDMLNICTARKLTSREVKYVARSILEVLMMLHEEGIVHTDIKPSNILANFGDGLDRSKEVQLADFADWHPVDHRNLAEGVEMGTPIFRAPEAQLQLELGPPMDIWSLGATLISLIFGENFHIFSPNVTFDDDRYQLEILFKHVRHFGPWPDSYVDLCCATRLGVLTYTMENSPPETYKPFRKFCKEEVPRKDRDFICKLMKLDPRDRPTARQLLADEWFQEEVVMEERLQFSEAPMNEGDLVVI
ncbi:kinase-like protein [Lophiostoma macrostomum CBS 122681]|uniref:Kinase-like protein n=1 Tax=Lophiostoma macrostomum CBS 122681 TaxID=1314788 RepID=A0A6A6TN52_9PLEO|nr:kinase-like protein [Lophiostoma macrostomum CBS 122681]